MFICIRMARFAAGVEGNALSGVTPPTAFRRFAAPRRPASLVWQCDEVTNALVTKFMLFSIKQRLNTLNFINVIC